VRRGAPLGLLLAVAAGCSGGLDKGFGVALTLKLDAIGDAQRASVHGFQIRSSGDEDDLSLEPVDRATGALKVERLIYRPRRTTRNLTLEVTAIDGNADPVGVGSTPPLTLQPGKTTAAEVVLLPPAPADLATPDDAGVPNDLSVPDDGSVILEDASTDGPLPDLWRPPSVLSFQQGNTYDWPMTSMYSTPTRMVPVLLNKDTKTDLLLYPGTLVALTNSDGMGAFTTSVPPVASYSLSAVGDLNGDGCGDYVVGSGVTLYVSLSSIAPPDAGSDCTYSGYTPYGLPSSVTDIALGDFDGNSKLDVAAGTSVGVSVFLNSGTGALNLKPRMDWAIANGTTFLRVADLDGDTRPDLIDIDYPDVTVLLNTGMVDMPGVDLSSMNPPLFDVQTPVSMPTTPNSAVVGDFGGNTKPDLLVQGTNLYLYYFINDGTGTLATAAQFVPDTSGFQLRAAADIDADGKPDLVGYSGASVDILYGTNTVSRVRETAVYECGGTVADVAVGDYNADGKLDFAAVNTDKKLGVYFNMGGGLFPNALQLTRNVAGTTSMSSAVGDFDGDGKLDVATVAITAAQLDVFPNRGGVRLGAPLPLVFGVNSPLALAVGDFTGDGRPDIVVANQSMNVLPLQNTGFKMPDGGAQLFSVPSMPPTVGTNSYAVGIGDFNKDTKKDLVVANYGSSNLSVLYGDGMGGFGSAMNYATNANPKALLVADFNNDMRPDVAAVTGGTTQQVLILLGNDNGIFSTGGPYTAGTTPIAIGAGLFNADDKLDLAFAEATGIGVLLNSGTGTFPAMIQPVMGQTGISALVVDDFNLDGKADIAFGQLFGAVARVSVLLGSGTGAFAAQKDFAIGSGITIQQLTSADLDGDHLPELIATVTNGVIVLRNTSQ
jgi:hypothetical protein